MYMSSIILDICIRTMGVSIQLRAAAGVASPPPQSSSLERTDRCPAFVSPVGYELEFLYILIDKHNEGYIVGPLT